MEIKQAFTDQLQGGNGLPSTFTLEAVAKTEHGRLRIRFVPEEPGQEAPR